MSTPDDERFEVYLKQFRPLAPEPLRTVWPGHRARRTFGLWTSIAAAAAILVMGVLTLHIRSNRARVTESVRNVGNSEHFVDDRPLTIWSANALLAKAPSFKAMVDDMAFRSQTIPVPKGKRSAIAILGQEKIKL
ncbi:MAG: hypothetical protein DMG38_18800 [Acidobacteria bacterium]|nr:MAG: hypothetical protein DMG38_18800 [Acidobacteriota bacterium]